MQVRKVSETTTTITLGWDPVPGAEGYVFYADGQRVSRTCDRSRRTVKFSKGPTVFTIEAVIFSSLDSGNYPPVAQTYKKVAPRVAYKDGASDARYCCEGQPGVTRLPGDTGWRDEVAEYDNDGLCRGAERSGGSPADCPTSAKEIDGRPYCSLPTQGEPTQNTGSWLI